MVMNIHFAGHYQFVAKSRTGNLGAPPKLDGAEISTFVKNFILTERGLPEEERGIHVLQTTSGPQLDGIDSLIEREGLDVLTPRPGDRDQKVIVLTGQDQMSFWQSKRLMHPSLESKYLEGFFYRTHPNADVIEI